MNRLSLRNDQLKFKTAGKLPIILEESVEYTPNLIKENRTMSTCNPVGLANTRSQSTMPGSLDRIRQLLQCDLKVSLKAWLQKGPESQLHINLLQAFIRT